MEFAQFKTIFQNHVASTLEHQSFLFTTDVDPDQLWETYLSSFPPGTNEIYRERREMDCSCCRHFIKRVGGLVTIVDNELVSLWDFDPHDLAFSPVIKALSDLVKSSAIKDVFVTKDAKHGTDKNREMQGDRVHTWEHFYIELPERFLQSAPNDGRYRTSKAVFKRSLEEISKDAIETILDLIAEKTLYRGEEWQGALQKLLSLHNEYHSLPDAQKENFLWSKSVNIGGAISRIRNHSIGVLLQDLTSGVDVSEAVRRYEHIVAPTNYKRPKAIFTKKMVEDAEATVTELGLLDSLGRRHATLSDITINNVLWANRDASRHMSGIGGVFEMLKEEITVDPGKFENVPGMSMDDFIGSLPDISSIDILLENRHEPNLVTLIAPKAPDSPTLFKWDNAFSWAYNGNIADSMKQRVKAAGGNVDGVLRFSLQWNDGDRNLNDYDAHCVEPDRNHIWFQNKGRRHRSSGMLDVDIINPTPGKAAVENITWLRKSQMSEGVYHFYVHNYSHNGGRSGFDAEIEYDGRIYEFAYHKNLAQDEKVTVAKIRFSKQDGITFVESLPTTTSTRTIWGLQTNRFHPVSTFMFSPNHWDGQRTGNRHFFFMLAGCKSGSRPNGFFNEYLKQDFMEHKRVFEALGSKMRVEETEDQLSGLGFSSTRRASLICKVDGRMVKVIL